MQQLALIPSGAQPWQKYIAGSFISHSETETTKFAYSSTLATYIFELTIPSSASVSKSSSTDPVPSTKPSTIQKYNVQLCKVISEFEFGNTIAMDWSPHQSNQLAIANSKNQINIYSIQFESPPPIGTRKVEMQQSAGPFSEQLQRAKPRVFSRDIDAVMSDVDRAVTGGKGDSNRISGTGSSGDYEIILTIKSAEPAEWIAYAPLNHLLFAFSDRKRTIKFCLMSDQAVSCSVSSDTEITSIQWHPKLNNTLLFGEAAGTVISVEISGAVSGSNRLKASKRRIEFKSDAMKSLNVNGDAVCDIKFDPNSDNYALIAFSSGNMVLGDIKTGQAISNFQQPGSAASHHPVGQQVHDQPARNPDCASFIIQWMPHVPGGFLSTDLRAGIFHVWNVSQPHPLFTRRLLPSPIHIIQPLVPPHQCTGDPASQQLKPFFIIAFDDGSIGLYNTVQHGWSYLRYGGHTETIFSCECLKSPSAVQLVDYGNDRRLLQKLADSVFHPMLLATCSFDGTVKLWDLDNSTNNAPADQFRSSSTAVSMLTMTQYDTTSRRCQLNQIDVPQNVGRVSLLQDDCGLEVSMIDSFPLMSYGRKQADGVMNTAHGLWYSVSWSSDGSYRLVAGSSTGMVMVYDAKQARVVGEYSKVHRSPVYRVCWNPHHRTQEKPYGGMIATSSADCSCAIVNPETGQIMRRLKMDDEAFGCDWSSIDGALLAVGCKSGTVSVWNLNGSTSGDAPLAVLKGHTKRVFNTAWSPLESDWLATAADDCDVRVWSINERVTISRLQGHTKNVRGLAWSPEIRQILLSGSWDSDIRVWNVLDSSCLAVISGHAADVYGISFVHSHPLLLFSCSRDNTFRLWSMAELCSQSKWRTMRAMQRCRWDEAAARFGAVDGTSTRERFSNRHDFHYEGIYGRLIRALITDSTVEVAEKWKRVMQFFSPLNGTLELWNMVSNCAMTRSVKQPSHQQISKSLSLNSRDETLQLAEMRAQLLESNSIQQQIDNGTLQIPPFIIGDPQFLQQLSGSSTSGNYSDAYLSALGDIPVKTRAQMQSLAEAAQLRLLLGQMRKYCETMCTLGHWERAIAISPALGVDYWRSLLRRYNQHLLQSVEDNNGGSGSTQCTAASQALFPFLLAAGDASSLVDYLCSGNQQPICPAADKNNSLQLAYLLASAVDAGMFEANSASGTAPQTASAAANSNGAFTAPRLQAAANGGRLPSLRPTEPSKATEALAEMRPFSAPVPAVANCNTNNPQALTNRVITHATHQFPSISAAEQSLETVEDCRDSYSSKMAAAWLLAGDDRRAAIQRLLDGRVYDHAYALAAVFNMPEFCERIESAMHRYQPT